MTMPGDHELGNGLSPIKTVKLKTDRDCFADSGDRPSTAEWLASLITARSLI